VADLFIRVAVGHNQRSARPVEGTFDRFGQARTLASADFQTIVSLLATQVMVSLGALPNPMSGEAEVHPIHAKHFIDLLGVLQEKTKGNLSPEEDQGLESLMHELRMGFLAVQNMPADPNPAPPAVSGDAEENA
jgi:hypothetical protein